MKVNSMQFAAIFFKLVKTNLIIVRPQFLGKLLNVTIRSLSQIYISGYVMPLLGFGDNYGVILYAGIVGSVGLFECYNQIPGLIVDITGDRNISYYLTLPVPP